MSKKQASHKLPLYFLCGALLAGVMVLSIAHKKQEIDFSRSYSQEITTIPPVANEIDDFKYMSDLTEDAVEVAALFAMPPPKVLEELLSSYPAYDLVPKEAETTTPMIDAKPKVVVIIDDMGVSPYWSREISKLSAPLTLSFLPYAKDLKAQVNFAATQNHQLMLHMPMQAMNEALENTPGLLRVSDTPNHFLKVFNQNMNAFTGYTGVNNHMGSLLTQDDAKMNIVMNTLKAQGLYFIDSRTIHSSVAARVAERAGVPYMVRDVFLDHEDNIDYVRGALLDLENKAQENGVAIAIGHPKEATVLALQEWLPTLEEKNIALVGAEDVILQKFPNVTLKPYQKNQPAVVTSGIKINYAVDHTIDPEAIY